MMAAASRPTTIPRGASLEKLLFVDRVDTISVSAAAPAREIRPWWNAEP
jgi:hypothetical protein